MKRASELLASARTTGIRYHPWRFCSRFIAQKESQMRRTTTARMMGLILGAMLAGCASSEVVPASGPRPTLSPAAVKIYPTAPKKYEKHGPIEVEVTGEVRWEWEHSIAPMDLTRWSVTFRTLR